MSFDPSKIDTLPKSAREALADTIAKIGRAAYHYNNLVQALEEYRARKPFVTETIEKNGEALLVFRFRERIPPTISLTVADVIHNARTALDYLIYQDLKSNGQTPRKSNQFPISEDKKAFADVCGQSNNSKLKNVSASALNLVKRLRPYKGGNDILWLLHTFDIVDKHRALNIFGALTTNVAVRPKAYPRPDADINFPPADEVFQVFELEATPTDGAFPMRNGAILFTATNIYPGMYVIFEDVRIEIDFWLGDSKEDIASPVPEFLLHAIDHVAHIAYLFGRFVFS